MATSNVTIRIDSNLKNQGEELFNDLGLSMTAAITAFIKQAVRDQSMPFKLTRKAQSSEIPNKETLEAFKEIEEMKRNPDKYKSYSDVNEMMKDILNWHIKLKLLHRSKKK